VEPFASFIVPTLYCAYMELKMHAGMKDDVWTDQEDEGPSSEKEKSMVTSAA
jgi:Cu(I)/Ag(I) efflux system membrane protein CusA/SilA